MRKYIIVAMLLASFGLFGQSRGVQFLKSLVVPGLSQVSDGRSYGYGMMVSEISIIGGMLYLNSEQKLRARESYEFALKYAHIRPGTYTETYFRDMSRYNNGGYEADGYNARVRRDAMALYPHDAEMQQQYIDAHAYPEDMYWSWDSPDQRARYSKIRIKTQDLRDFGQIAVGVLLLNHLISGIDVLRYNSEDRRSQVYMSFKGKQPLINLKVRF